MTSGDKIYDVAIIGGGFAGLCLALALGGPHAQTPLSVIVLDNQIVPDKANAVSDGRSSSFAPASRIMLETLGIWQKIAEHAQPINDIIVTDSKLNAPSRPQFLHFGEEHTGSAPLAHMLENTILLAELMRQVKSLKNIDILAPIQFTDYDTKQNHVAIKLAGGNSLKAKLLIGADGRNSDLRKSAGFKKIGWSYAQCGIVTTIAHEKPHNSIAEEHFLPSGPFAILPLTGNRASLVWTEEEGEAKRLIKLSDDDFMDELRRRFGTHLGDVSLAGEKWSYPLSMHLVHEYVAPRIALIGDAAHVMHPIAGLGLNMGLRDVAALAEVIADAVHLGIDFGTLPVLEKYQAWRRFDNLSAALMCDGLNRLFSNDRPAVRALRDAGLRMVDGLTPFKRFFSSEASGTLGEVPKLLRGENV